MYSQECIILKKTDLFSFEVTQGFDDDLAVALVFGVSGFQPHNAPGLVDQMLNLPLVFHNDLFLSLKNIKQKQDQQQ